MPEGSGPDDPSRVPRLGPYRLERRIGRGGMADVFLGEAVEGPHAGQKVAVKRLIPRAADDPEMVDRFLGEADLGRLIQHPGLVAVLDAGNFRGAPYLVMEYVDGRDLAMVIHRCRQGQIDLPVPFVTHIAARVLESLEVVHAARGADGTPLGIVHCDVNPANVFISRVGEIKLGDFGVAMVGAQEARDLGGEVRGKLGYLAPEQAMGEEVDPRTDLYAVGALLYELLTLERPYVAESLEELAEAYGGDPPWVPSILRADVPRGLDELVMRLLALSPADRFDDATAVLTALGPFQDELVGTDLAIAAVVRGLFPG